MIRVVERDGKMKCYKYLLVFLVLFLPSVGRAYDYVNENNESSIKQFRKDVYHLKDLYDELIPEEEQNYDEDYIDNYCGTASASPNEFIWPIGSDEVTIQKEKQFALGNPYQTTITSYFGPRPENPEGHGALDIAPSNGTGNGVVNIIAAKDGKVIYSSKGISQCPTGSMGNRCGGGYGNYVVIKHDNGLYTLYAHMYQDTITVGVGEKVSQGQVIGKMGSSGSSTGTHLHFEFTNSSIYGIKNKYDPLKYVNPKKPRGKDSSNNSSDDTTITNDECGQIPQKFSSLIAEFEGTGPTDGDYYVAYKPTIDSTTWTIGHGLTNYASAAFKKFGIDVADVSPGSKYPKKIIDQVYEYNLSLTRKNVEKEAKKYNLNLNNNQILALTSFAYNGGMGPVEDIFSQYQSSMNTYKPYTYLCDYVRSNGVVRGGLIKRRKVEWILYTSGIYTNNSNQTGSDNGTPCIGDFNIPSSDKLKVSKVLDETASKFNGKISYY